MNDGQDIQQQMSKQKVVSADKWIRNGGMITY